MTTNDRLFDAGLLSEWNAAARSHNRDRMIELLGKVDLEDQAEWIADTILSNPASTAYSLLCNLAKSRDCAALPIFAQQVRSARNALRLALNSLVYCDNLLDIGIYP
jgi:hypothetical protein